MRHEIQVSPAATIPIIYLKRRQACVRSAKCVLAPLKGELSRAKRVTEGARTMYAHSRREIPYKTETSVPDPSTAYAVPLP